MVVLLCGWAGLPAAAQEGPGLWQPPAESATPSMNFSPAISPPVIAPPMTPPSGFVPPGFPPPGNAPPVIPAPQPGGTLRAPPPSQADMVVDVRVVGNQNVPLTKIVPHVRTRSGRPFDQDLLEADVRRLSQTKMFVNVKTFTRRVNGGVIVVFEVLERPTLHYVRFVGNESYGAKALRKEIELKSGDPMDPFAVTEGRRKIEEYYNDHGFAKARVTIVEGDKPTDKGAVYLINEGIKQKIRWTHFVGNNIASGERLLTIVESKPGSCGSSKGSWTRKRSKRTRTSSSITTTRWAFSRSASAIPFDFSESQKWATMIFVIDEGPRSIIHDMSIVGNQKFATAELMEKLKLTRQQPFTKTQMDADVQPWTSTAASATCSPM